MRFDWFTLDELHTLGTALGNAVKNIHRTCDEVPSLEARGYMATCIVDNELLLREVNEAIRKK